MEGCWICGGWGTQHVVPWVTDGGVILGEGGFAQQLDLEGFSLEQHMLAFGSVAQPLSALGRALV